MWRTAYRIVAYERCCSGSNRAIPQGTNTILLDLRRVGQPNLAHEYLFRETRTLDLKIVKPAFPSVCIVVLTVSIGVKIIRKQAAATAANMVLTRLGNCLMYEFDCRSARMPTFAAVSKNRETGPWIRAAVRP